MMRKQAAACFVLLLLPAVFGFTTSSVSTQLRGQVVKSGLGTGRTENLSNLCMSESGKNVAHDSKGLMGKCASIMAAAVVGFSAPKTSVAEPTMMEGEETSLAAVQSPTGAQTPQPNVEPAAFAVVLGTVGGAAMLNKLKKPHYTSEELIDKVTAIVEEAEACKDKTSAMKVLENGKEFFEALKLKADAKMSILSLPGRLYAIESRPNFPMEAIIAASKILEEAEACSDKASALQVLDDGKDIFETLKLKPDSTMSILTLPGRLHAVQSRPGPLPPKGKTIVFNEPAPKASAPAQKVPSAPAISDEQSESIRKRVATELETASRLNARAQGIISRAEESRNKEAAIKVLKEGRNLFKGLKLSPDPKMSTSTMPGRLNALCVKYGITNLQDELDEPNVFAQAIGSLFSLTAAKPSDEDKDATAEPPAAKAAAPSASVSAVPAPEAAKPVNIGSTAPPVDKDATAEPPESNAPAPSASVVAAPTPEAVKPVSIEAKAPPPPAKPPAVKETPEVQSPATPAKTRSDQMLEDRQKRVEAKDLTKASTAVVEQQTKTLEKLETTSKKFKMPWDIGGSELEVSALQPETAAKPKASAAAAKPKASAAVAKPKASVAGARKEVEKQKADEREIQRQTQTLQKFESLSKKSKNPWD